MGQSHEVLECVCVCVHVRQRKREVGGHVSKGHKHVIHVLGHTECLEETHMGPVKRMHETIQDDVTVS